MSNLRTLLVLRILNQSNFIYRRFKNEKIILITCVFGLNFNASASLEHLLSDYQGMDTEYGYINQHENDINVDCYRESKKQQMCILPYKSKNNKESKLFFGNIFKNPMKFFSDEAYCDKMDNKIIITEKMNVKLNLGIKKIAGAGINLSNEIKTIYDCDKYADGELKSEAILERQNTQSIGISAHICGVEMDRSREESTISKN